MCSWICRLRAPEIAQSGNLVNNCVSTSVIIHLSFWNQLNFQAYPQTFVDSIEVIKFSCSNNSNRFCSGILTIIIQFFSSPSSQLIHVRFKCFKSRKLSQFQSLTKFESRFSIRFRFVIFMMLIHDVDSWFMMFSIEMRWNSIIKF